MPTLDVLIVLVFSGLTLLGQGFLLLFRGLLFEGGIPAALASLPVTAAFAFGTTAAGALVLGLLVAAVRPVDRALGSGSAPDPQKVMQALGSLDRLPWFFLAANAAVFVAGTLVQALVLGVLGLPVPQGFDLAVWVLAAAATGGMGMLQGLAMTDSLLVRFRERLRLEAVPEKLKDLSLPFRLLSATLGSVFLGGILIGSAALALYRDLGRSSGLAPEALAARQGAMAAELAAVLVFVAVWAFFLVGVVVWNLHRQLKRLDSRVGELSTGNADLTRRVPVVFFDELGTLTQRINGFLLRLQSLVAEVKNETVQVETSSNRVRSEAEEAAITTVGLSGSQGKVQGAVTAQILAIHDAEDLLKQVTQTTDVVDGHVSGQARLVTESAEATAEMALSIASVGEVTAQADQVGRNLVATTRRGSETMAQMGRAMAEIETASQSVADIAGIIAKISAQTNLLAMNAAIEAAHAGTAGTGFAVVADEVRSLAETSAKNAREVRDHVRSMGDKIRSGGAMAHQAEEDFAEIESRITETEGLLATITAAVGEQKRAMGKVKDSSGRLVEATAKIRTEVEDQRHQTGQAAQAMSDIIQSTRQIEQAVTSQTVGTNRLAQSMAKVAGEAQENSGAAGKLGGLVQGFNV